MAKPLTLTKARPLLGSLYPDARIHLEFRNSLCLAFFGQEMEARFEGETWEEVLAEATKQRFQTK